MPLSTWHLARHSRPETIQLPHFAKRHYTPAKNECCYRPQCQDTTLRRVVQDKTHPRMVDFVLYVLAALASQQLERCYIISYASLSLSYTMLYSQLKGFSTVKSQLGYRIEPRLKDGLEERARRTGTPATKILEEYITAGLARDNGELIEQNSLPAIRAAVREEVARTMTELYQQLSADLQKSARKSDDRLAALIVKAARSAGIAQRMLFSLASKLVTYDFALKIWESAKEQVGKDLAKPDPSQP